MTKAKPATGLPDWMQDHVNRYLATNGADGHMMTTPGGTRPVPTLLLTTTGRKSGEKFLFPLIYGREGRNYIVVASKGGAPEDPGWYKNLVQDPHVSFQVIDKTFTGTARTATGGERSHLWTLMAGIFPTYDDYRKKTDREIPVVALEPA